MSVKVRPLDAKAPVAKMAPPMLAVKVRFDASTLPIPFSIHTGAKLASSLTKESPLRTVSPDSMMAIDDPLSVKKRKKKK